jgi:hypothetical protein
MRLREEFGLSVSDDAVYHALKALGFRFRLAEIRPLSTSRLPVILRHTRARLDAHG